MTILLLSLISSTAVNKDGKLMLAIFVMLNDSEASNRLHTRQQILRYAQDDNIIFELNFNISLQHATINRYYLPGDISCHV
jgi:hypothetical protein